MLINELCEILPWDTDFFGRSIGRVRASRLESGDLHYILTWGREHNIDCLYLLADSDHAGTIRLAEDGGFRFVDIRLTLELALEDRRVSKTSSSSISVRPWRSSDIPILEQIAASIYTQTRFYYDPCFTEADCALLYRTWIRKSCQGYADQVLVAESEGIIHGFITCSANQEARQGTIGLVGTGNGSKGLGVGQVLTSAALDWFAQQECQTIKVTTQGRNVAAQRLYQRFGFVTHSVQLWYHKWFNRCAEPDVQLENN